MKGAEYLTLPTFQHSIISPILRSNWLKVGGPTSELFYSLPLQNWGPPKLLAIIFQGDLHIGLSISIFSLIMEP
jgi:hypothetical protein